MNSTINKTLEHTFLLARHLNKRNLRGAVIVFLMELGASTKQIGFELLLYAILLQNKNPTRALSCDIYQEIKLHYGLMSEEQVEQAIREVIKAAWINGSREAWDWYFSYADKPVTAKPTNSEFISQLAYILELWQASAENTASLKR